MVHVYPNEHLVLPTARASKSTTQRPRCCATAICNICPVDAKFTALNGMAKVLDDPRVSILLDAEVKALNQKAGQNI